ncbi:MAG: phosphatidylserine/phosphatidylglycerophosphate/cardiolipin synthase family protein [Bdellovibrionales bacterium]
MQKEIPKALESHEWRYFLSPRATWDAMYADCAAAEASIDMEQYIFENDETGEKFMELFILKAKAGIKVSLLIDKVGSASFYFSPLLDEFRKAGGIMRFYNSPRLLDIFKPRRFFPRTHIKAMVVDSSILYIGGVCLAKRMENWRDTQIRITGPVVRPAGQALERNRGMRKASDVAAQNPDSDFLYIQSEPRFFRHPIYMAMVDAVKNARKFVYISQAIFIPTRRLRRALYRAAARGVEVIVLVPLHSDVPVADWAGLSYARRLLRNRVRLYHYMPTVLHNKIIMTDDGWGMIGSANMDALSFFHNREANVIIRNETALAEMKQDFLNDLRQSREFTLKLLREIPLWKRAAAYLARLFRAIL